MHKRLTVCSAAATALFLALGITTQAEAGMYRYTDEEGRTVISNTIPQPATKRGYDILNSNGRVVEVIPPAPTDDEIAAREAEKQRQEELAIQREKDTRLLKRFSHPDQAIKAMHRKLGELQGLIQLKRGNISVISSQLDNEQSRAANMERTGQKIPDATLEKIRRLESQIRDIEREISWQAQEIESLKQTYEKDIKRLEEVTGETRTLSLEPANPSE
jgi:predicted RNase H-like nuclease (RuvC/YqgF family)